MRQKFMADGAIAYRENSARSLEYAARIIDPDVVIRRNWSEEGVFVFAFSDGSFIRTANWKIVAPAGYERLRIEKR